MSHLRAVKWDTRFKYTDDLLGAMPHQACVRSKFGSLFSRLRAAKASWGEAAAAATVRRQRRAATVAMGVMGGWEVSSRRRSGRRCCGPDKCRAAVDASGTTIGPPVPQAPAGGGDPGLCGRPHHTNAQVERPGRGAARRGAARRVLKPLIPSPGHRARDSDDEGQ